MKFKRTLSVNLEELRIRFKCGLFSFQTVILARKSKVKNCKDKHYYVHIYFLSNDKTSCTSVKESAFHPRLVVDIAPHLHIPTERDMFQLSYS